MGGRECLTGGQLLGKYLWNEVLRFLLSSKETIQKQHYSIYQEEMSCKEQPNKVLFRCLLVVTAHSHFIPASKSWQYTHSKQEAAIQALNTVMGGFEEMKWLRAFRKPRVLRTRIWKWDWPHSAAWSSILTLLVGRSRRALCTVYKQEKLASSWEAKKSASTVLPPERLQIQHWSGPC